MNGSVFMRHTLNRQAMGKRIRKWREELNLSREQLAEILDITTKFFGNIESGSRSLLEIIDSYQDKLQE